MPAGRPSGYNARLVETICRRIADGQSLREICRGEGMPSKWTVLCWLDKHVEFQAQYARARDLQADHFGEEILAISDDATNDWMERQGQDGEVGWQANGEHIQRSRLRVDSRKWLMSKVAPKKYGDKLEHTGKDGGPIALALTIEGLLQRIAEKSVAIHHSPPKDE